MSEISRALLEPLATDESSASSIESLASDDARAKRIIDQGLWIDPATIVVGRRLASGGMGELRLGRMTLPAAGAGSAGRRGKTKVTVVLKSSFIEMLGGDSDEFWHEASMLSQIKHPQVVRLFGVTQKEVRGMLNAETKKRLFLVMEYCPNGSLTDAVRKPGGYDRKRDFLRHAKQITSTLAWLHAQGIVHRDIKPSNVLLDDEGSAKLCDLGLSRFQPGIGPGATPSVGFTSATMTVGAGSAPYMPPEGLAADSQDRQRQYDGRAWDVYSLSMLLSQMWTRKQLYEGLGVFQIVVRVSQGMRPELATDSREVPPRLREIVSSMWDADRHARPSAEEVLTMLRDPALAAQIEACEG
jgi:serine/threonine protein kinase